MVEAVRSWPCTAAGVAVPTVYASAGTKPALLRHLIDRLDEQAGVPGLAAELVSSDDALNVLNLSIASSASSPSAAVTSLPPCVRPRGWSQRWPSCSRPAWPATGPSPS